MSSIDPILIGDNPFFGVDHLSQERSRNRLDKIGNIKNISEILNLSLNFGIKGIVVSTRPELKDLVGHLDEIGLLKRLEFYPIIPYIQKYVTMLTEKGVVGAIQQILEPASSSDKIKLFMKGGLIFLKKDLNDMFRVFLDMELLNLRNASIKMVFLHDTIVDLSLSLGLKDLFITFNDHIGNRARVGLVTKNLPLLLRRFHEWNIPVPPVMMAFNKIGYQMNPSIEKCEETIKKFNPDIIAMSVLAAGYLKPSEAIEYIARFQQIKSIVIGVSSPEHVDNTFNTILDVLKRSK